MLAGKWTIVIAFIALISFRAAARAQSPDNSDADDPAARAMERILAAVEQRAAAADRIMAASKLVNESIIARKHGRNEEAREALEKAERMVAEAALSHHDALTAALERKITDEQEALNPRVQTAVIAQRLPAARSSGNAQRLVLARYNSYRESLARILTEERVPIELLSVAQVESGFNSLALSRKGARGIWQLMPATAARYGLSVQPMDDHRTHPEHSTRAAARYLRDLYQQFGDWKLALAAYNWGEDKVQRVIDKTGILDFDALSRRGLLPLETRNYVPAVLAVWPKFSGLTVRMKE